MRKQRQEMEEDLADLKMKQKKIKEVEMVRDNNKILRGEVEMPRKWLFRGKLSLM